MVAYIQNFQRMSEASAAGGELHRRRIDGVYDEAINEMILGVTWTLTILTLLVVALRFFVRGQVFRKWYSDDWVMLFALFAQLVYQIFTQFCCRATLEATIEADKTGAEKFTIDAAKWIIIAIVPSMVASVAGRVSGTILMCRIFASVRWFVWYMWIMTVVQVILGIFYILALYLAVFPLKALWDPSVPSHEIIPMRVSTAMNIPVGTLFAVADITYVVFPAIIAWRLQISPRRRAGLAFIMSLSIIPAGASIVQIVANATHLLAPINESPIWGTIEQTAVIMIGCIPAILPITKINHPIVDYVKKWHYSFTGRRSSGSGDQGSPGQGGSPGMDKEKGPKRPTIGSFRTRPIRRQRDESWDSDGFVGMDDVKGSDDQIHTVKSCSEEEGEDSKQMQRAAV